MLLTPVAQAARKAAPVAPTYVAVAPRAPAAKVAEQSEDTGPQTPNKPLPQQQAAQRPPKPDGPEERYMAYLGRVGSAAGTRMRAAIVTVPDPVATRLGRSFDLEVAALVSAFEVREYVLDGFWLTWPTDDKTTDKDSAEKPSALVFRTDVWRPCLTQ